ncbi:MAG: hypothetical protein OES34_07245 [Nitrosopumilus sp.]|nr:hypothetical protein [Nitrosopumilus sp.]
MKLNLFGKKGLKTLCQSLRVFATEIINLLKKNSRKVDPTGVGY